MPDEDNNFGGSLDLVFRKWWRHVQRKNSIWNSIALIWTMWAYMGKASIVPFAVAVFLWLFSLIVIIL